MCAITSAGDNPKSCASSSDNRGSPMTASSPATQHVSTHGGRVTRMSDLVTNLAACREHLDQQRYVVGLHVELLDWAIAELQRLAAVEERALTRPVVVSAPMPAPMMMAPPPHVDI